MNSYVSSIPSSFVIHRRHTPVNKPTVPALHAVSFTPKRKVPINRPPPDAPMKKKHAIDYTEDLNPINLGIVYFIMDDADLNNLELNDLKMFEDKNMFWKGGLL